VSEHADPLAGDASASVVQVAIDAGPLLGTLTGVGAAVEQTVAAVRRRDDVHLIPYALSFRGTLREGVTRLPLPAALALRMWSHLPVPRLDRWMRPAQVVHGTNYTIGPSRLPRLVTVYDCWFLRNPAQASPAVRRAGRVLRRAVDSGAAVHASSHATADAVRELLGTDRVHVIPLAALPQQDGAAAGRADAPIAELIGVPFVLALGTLERRKNLPRLVAAFGHVAATQSRLRLVLAGGEGDDRSAIDASIDALPAAARARVIVTNRVDAQVKHWLLAKATVLAYPSLDEGFGFPLLEAMQYRIPVVASNAGSIPEVAGDGALLVDPQDVDALAGALATAVEDTAQRTALIAAGAARLHHFSWDDTAAQLASLYHRLRSEGT